MDLDKIRKLADSELRLKVAELCGTGRPYELDGKVYVDSPDYASDLEAMQVAVATLPDSGSNSEYHGMETYLRVLIHEVRGEWPGLQRDYDGDLRAVERATARQRAIAFVCTMEQEKPT